MRPADLAAAFLASGRHGREPSMPGLAEDLSGRAETARAWRTEGDQPVRALLDGSHVTALRRVVEVWGWPGFALVGGAGSVAAVEIALLCANAPLLRRLLRVLEGPVRTGDAALVFRALLHDRACVLEGQAGWYGTQQRAGPHVAGELWPVAEPALLAVRRAQAGLDPLDAAVADRAVHLTAA
ncbi:hypothetical protein [Streptomyces sp. NPDC059247]|uniref:hypothetical protein n=1 Tax=Streptomyces sp. NPDC059247 TaxID=3346790 RepID=UPI0036AF23D4